MKYVVLKSKNNQSNVAICRELKRLRQENQQLKHQLAVKDKALKLAVDYMFKELKLDGYQDIHYDGNDLTLIQENMQVFIDQAEKELKE